MLLGVVCWQTFTPNISTSFKRGQKRKLLHTEECNLICQQEGDGLLKECHFSSLEMQIIQQHGIEMKNMCWHKINMKRSRI
jgi:hypothetical protein